MRKRGFTLLEIIISVVIFTLTVTGMANVFLTGKRWILHARSRMAGGELGKFFLDPLQMEVRQDTWDQAGNQLRLPALPAQNPAPTDTRTWQGTTVNLGSDNIPYTPTYTASRVLIPGTNTDSGLRCVQVRIDWREHAP